MIITIDIAKNEFYITINNLVREGHEEHVMKEPTVF